jgi:MarR family transcriptional regulator for hemolysin
MTANGGSSGKVARQGKSSYEIYRSGGSTPDIQLTVLLVLVARRWRSLLDEKLRPIEQSSARMEALSAIFNSQERPSQVDIAKRLRIEGPTLTRMLDTLEVDGLVKRQPDPGDRRSKKLEVTPKGEGDLKEIFEVADIYRDRLLDGMSDSEKGKVIEVLRLLLGRLDEGLPGDDEGGV